jgi:tight adherence protein C
MTPDQLQTIINLLMLLALLSVLALWWAMRFSGYRGRIVQRIRECADMPSPIAAAQESDINARGLVHGLAARLAVLGDRMPFFDANYRVKLQRDMVGAGYRSRHAVSVLLGVKFCFGILCATMTVMLGSHVPVFGQYPIFRGVMMVGMFIIGMIVPEYIMAMRSASRRRAIASCLPDALDLLVICTNAGNSLLVSIRRVADELATICPPLSAEFALTADELTLSGDSGRALNGLAERVDLPSVRALISTLTQSMRYGTPITQALRVLSRTERLAHMVSLEEKAAKLAPKMVVPMMLFILPAICVIAAGPAVIQLLEFVAQK